MANPGHRLVYTALSPKHIRLFGLSPGAPDDPITGWVEDVSLDDLDHVTRPFQALSYTWGDPSNTAEISVRDALSKRTGMIKVTWSLIDFLKSVRHPEHVAGIWVDQICIDQGNEYEKGEQIALMRVIYERATNVVAWLGPTADESDLAMDMLHGVEWIHERYFNAAFFVALQRNEQDLEMENRDRAFRAIDALIARPYWLRTWVWQECTAHMGKTNVRCGGKAINLSRVFYYLTSFRQFTASAMVRQEKWPQNGLMRMIGFLDFIVSRQMELKPTLLGLLFKLRETKVTDARDKVFAMLSFAEDVGEDLIPDFNKTPQAVYTEFTLWHLTNYQSLDILSYCNGQRGQFSSQDQFEGQVTSALGVLDIAKNSDAPRPMVNLPSWVPDWRSSSQAGYQRHVWPIPKNEDIFNLDTPALFRASGSVKSMLEVDRGWKEDVHGIAVRGMKIATISHVENARLPHSTLLTVEEEWYRNFKTSKPSNWEHQGDELFKRTIFSDLKADVNGIILRYRRAKTADELNWPFTAQNLQVELGTLKRVTSMRAPFRTSAGAGEGDGLYGLGPAWAGPGDEVWILQGASVPFILRPHPSPRKIWSNVADLSNGTTKREVYDTGETLYFNIGECFVLGLMDGEVLELLNAQGDKSVSKLPEIHSEFGKVVLH